MTTGATVLEGDALATLATLPANSFDAMLTDPPYGIAFMGKKWDTFKAGDIAMRRNPQMDAVNTGNAKQGGRQRACVDYQKRQARDARAYQDWITAWATEALRVLKPGAFALVACGTRTQHRMVSGLEDAGFEVRDVIAWLYGSGFPKSHDVSKAIDRQLGSPRDVQGRGDAVDRTALDYGGATGKAKNGLRAEWERDDDPRTPNAARWQGYGTALKPAMELWTLVRKPPEGTVAANALRHGTGALNIDGTRIRTAVEDAAYARNASGDRGHDQNRTRGMEFGMTAGSASALGRWPANVIHDGSDEVLAGFPNTTSVGHTPRARGRGGIGQDGHAGQDGITEARFDSGSVARFFYTAKASRREREAGLDEFDRQVRRITEGHGLGPANTSKGDGTEPRENRPTATPHPTVKPIALTRYLATLLLPPKRDTPRRILTPFCGVGSEMIGALQAGWEAATGIEIDARYASIARERIRHHTSRGPLFDEEMDG
jgi:DNA modification methylase